MSKKAFRIICYSNSDVTFYETKVKSWLGWISFSVFYKADIVHVFTDPSAQKSLAYERIYQYCTVKGYNKKDITITEINETEGKRWIFFHNVNLLK